MNSEDSKPAVRPLRNGTALPRNRDLNETQPIPHWPRPGDGIWSAVKSGELDAGAVAEISEFLSALASLDDQPEQVLQ